jgi:hypothetical protein
VDLIKREEENRVGVCARMCRLVFVELWRFGFVHCI